MKLVFIYRVPPMRMLTATTGRSSDTKRKENHVGIQQ